VNNREQVCLNFIRPDVGRSGNYDFIHNGPWLAGQFKELGVKWNRMPFSWVVLQPEPDAYDWSAYDRIVEACDQAGLSILATLGGHFDQPPVPVWAGETLAQVLNRHPEYIERFVSAWVERYHKRIKYWEILNEPNGQHFDLTVSDYVAKLLKPCYRIIKEIDPSATVLPCAYSNLPRNGDKEEFWTAGSAFCDIHNTHIYTDWGYFRTDTTAYREEKRARDFRELMVKHGEGGKTFWVTETGWWGTSGLTGSMYDVYRKDAKTGLQFKLSYTGKEIMEHPVVLREDALRAEWMKDLFPRLLCVPGCDKVFLWVALDEFAGGFDPDRVYGRPEGANVHGSEFTIWAIIAGDRSWRKSAYALQEIMRR
jgi:hypothetical protein